MGHKNKKSLVRQVQENLQEKLNRGVGTSKHLDKQTGSTGEKIYSWEMYRAAANEEERQQKEEVFSGIRYIACQVDCKTRAYNEVGFSPCEPPVLIDESTVLVSYERLLEIKAADKKKTPSKAKKDESEEKNYNDQADFPTCPTLDMSLPF